MTADPVAVAVQIASVLRALGVRHILGGSLASVAFGEPRATLDVDIAADLEPSHVDAFVAAVAIGFVGFDLLQLARELIGLAPIATGGSAEFVLAKPFRHKSKQHTQNDTRQDDTKQRQRDRV